jgi:hypothetical protein
MGYNAVMKRSTIMLMLMLLAPVGARADAFDNYTLPMLQKLPESGAVKEVTALTPDLLVAHSGVLPNVEAAMIVISTNDNHWAKLLVSAARHKHVPMPGAEPEFVPILRIERYVTFREASDRAVLASGQGLSLFPGFHLNLDLGQVVPEKLGGDVVASEPKLKELVVKPVGKAKIYLLTKPLPEAAPQKTQKLEVGEKFEPAYFNGTFKLIADGRRSGVLRLKVGADNDVTGTLVSDQNGREYEVHGAVSKPNHKIQFVVQLPQTQEEFSGFMFTGNGKAIAGTSVLQGREAGFYAVRVEE